MRRALHRLWRIPLRYAFWLALPPQIIVGSLLYDGWRERAQLAAYARARGLDMPPFDMDQFVYFTREALKRNSAAIAASQVPAGDELEEIHLSVDRAALGELNADLPRSGKTDFKNGLIALDGRRWQVKARYMGDNHWHWLYPQKSWRIKAPKNEPIRDRRSFNIKNSPTAILIEETINTEISAELGLLAPDVRPIKLFLNGVFAGVYLWWDVTDESLLRRSRRMPGSIYSGDGAPADATTGVSRLWRDQVFWVKDASRNAELADDRTDIDLLIEAVNGDSEVEFFEFAQRYLDLEKFATFIALDRALGGTHHDFNHNHKIYFDPYRGRFEPIQWDLGAWHTGGRHATFDQALNPLLTALRRHPRFELRLQRALAELLESRLRPDALFARIHDWCDRVRPALAADGHRDARDWLRSGTLRLPVAHSTTFGIAEWDRRVRDLEEQYRERHDRLQATLADARLSYAAERAADGSHLILDLTASGVVASTWNALELGLRPIDAALYRDSNASGVLDDGDQLVARTDGGPRLKLAEPLYPGLAQRPRARGGNEVLFGQHELLSQALSYRYFLAGGGELGDQLALRASNAVTGAPIGVTRERQAEVDSSALFSLHPWRLPPEPQPETITLGPGDIAIEATRDFGAHVRVSLAPGTTLRLGPGVSLFFRGPVDAPGTEAEPISFERLDPGEPWGAVVLQGPATANSAFRHCRWRGGSLATRGLVRYSGMVSVLDTKRIVFEHCRIGDNVLGDDALHWGYVTGGRLAQCTFSGAVADAVDLDICRDVVVESCVFEKSGNDLLDVMTSEIEVRGCSFAFGGDKGASIGESSTADVRRSRFVGCRVGIEIKDGSLVRLGERVELRDCATGVNLYRKNLRYGAGGTLEAERVDYRGSGEAVVSDKRSTVRLGERAGGRPEG